MAYALTLVSGVPRMTTVASGGAITIKDEGSIIEANATVLNFTGTTVTAVQTSPGNVDVQMISSPNPLIYDETYSVGSTISAGTPVTLPSAGTYTSTELEVFLDGQRLTAGLDYTYVGSAPRTQVSFLFDLQLGDAVKFRTDRNYSDSPTIYSEYLQVVASGAGAGQINVGSATAGSNITLPLAKTYDSKELELWVNGLRLSYLLDYTYVGTPPARTQIMLTFDLQVGDVLLFVIDRLA